MASYEELAVAIFGVAPGGYDSTLKSYYNTNGEVSYADWMVGLLQHANPSVSSNSALASAITTNLLGNNTVTAANQLWFTNYVTTQLNSGVDAGTLVDSLINILDGISASDPNWGNAHSEFSNKAAVADYYAQIGGSATDLPTLSGVLSGVDSTAGSVATKEDTLTTAGTTLSDTYAIVNNGYNASIIHSSATHNNVWTNGTSEYIGGNYTSGVQVGVTSNSYGNTSFDFLATGYSYTSNEYQFADGKLILEHGSAIDYYSPGAGSFTELSINTGNYNDQFNVISAGHYSNEVVVGGHEASVTNANADGYVLVTDDSGNILNQVRIENTGSPTSYTNVSNVYQLDNGNTLAQINGIDSYMLLDNNLQIKETFSFSNGGTIDGLIRHADGTNIALVSNNTIDYLDSNFNVTSSVNLKLGLNSYASNLYGIAEGNGSLYVIAEDNNYHEVICKMSGTGVGSTIVSAYSITSNGSYINPVGLKYDNGLLYVQPLYNSSTMLSFNPDLGVSANPTGTYKINTENLTGTLVADTGTYSPTSTVISQGSGIYQVHSDVHLVGTATGTAYAMNSTGLFSTGSMGTIA